MLITVPFTTLDNGDIIDQKKKKKKKRNKVSGIVELTYIG